MRIDPKILFEQDKQEDEDDDTGKKVRTAAKDTAVGQINKVAKNAVKSLTSAPEQINKNLLRGRVGIYTGRPFAKNLGVAALSTAFNSTIEFYKNLRRQEVSIEDASKAASKYAKTKGLPKLAKSFEKKAATAKKITRKRTKK